MKKIYLYMLVATGCLATVSCSDDDSKSNSDSVVGTYKLLEFNAPVTGSDTPQNIAGSSACVTNWEIVLNTDGTYTTTNSVMTIDDTMGSGTLTCEPRTDTGSYIRSGNTLTLTTNFEGNAVAEYTISDDGNTLSRTYEGSYPEASIDGGFNLETGTVTEVYSRDQLITMTN